VPITTWFGPPSYRVLASVGTPFLWLGLIANSMRTPISSPLSYSLSCEAVFGERLRDFSAALWESAQVVLSSNFFKWWLGGYDSIEAYTKVVRCSRKHLFRALVLIPTKGRWRETLVDRGAWRVPCRLTDSSLVLMLEPTLLGSLSLWTWELACGVATEGLASTRSRSLTFTEPQKKNHHVILSLCSLSGWVAYLQ